MSAPVEAQSLSALTNLFANPPHYPRNPTHHVHPPLVLYIVRVPGSRDVFLSPLKPPTKASISLEAVQSSLYYLHVHTEDDEEVRRSADQLRQSEDSTRPSVTINRKPLPPTPFAKHPLPPIPSEDALQQENTHQPHLPQYEERRDGRSTQQWNGQRSDLCLKTNLDPPLHGQDAAHAAYGGIDRPTGDYALSPSLHEYQEVQPPSAGLVSASNAHDASATYVDGSGSRAQDRSQLDHPQMQLNDGAFLQRSSQFNPITLIRRDPASGSQWNIGTITFFESTLSGSNVKPISVELTTPGYGRFNKTWNWDTPRPGSAGSDVASIRKAIESATLSSASTTIPDSLVTPFTRLIDFRKMALSDLRRTMYPRTNSADSMGKMEPSKPGLEKNVLAFDSPWHGQCTFINGIDGNSLRIKHTIKGNSSTGDGVTASIGELRFNLGWSILGTLKSPRNRRTEAEPDKIPIPKLIESKKENFRKSFQHLKERSRESFQRGKYHRGAETDDVLGDLSNVQTPMTNNLASHDRQHPRINTPDNDEPYMARHNDYPSSHTLVHPTSSEDNDDELSRLSLKLGREKAGGGFRGHSAKLGKLIIEDEGLKMCDLVVGAAMGVWWQHYEGRD